MFFSYGSLNICTAGDADPSEEEDLAMELESPVNNDVSKESEKTEVQVCKLVKCPMCRQYVTTSNYSRHKQRKHPHRIFKNSHHKDKYKKKAKSFDKVNSVFSCPEPCGQAFRRNDNLARHQQRKSCKLNHTVRCTICHETFFGFGQLNHHFKKRRCNQLYECLNCNSNFRTEKDLVTHIEACPLMI